MHQHLLPLIVIFLLLVSWLIENRHYQHIWITHRRSQPNIAKHKHKNKSHLIYAPSPPRDQTVHCVRLKRCCHLKHHDNVINTSFVERMNLTLRHHVPALARRIIQIAKTALGLEQQISLIGANYNFRLTHSSLRLPLPMPTPTKGNGSPKLWEQRTPAMAAGITDHIWTMKELLMFRAPPYYQPMPPPYYQPMPKRIAA